MKPPRSGEVALPLVDLSTQYNAIRQDATAAFDRLALAGEFEMGEELERFEEEFARYCGVTGCVGVSSGTDALLLALQALELPADAEVVTVPNTYVATVEAIARAGARPVLVDVDPETACMSLVALESALGARTAAVIPVHLYGRPAAMPEISSLCRGAGVAVVEDAAQAHGGEVGGRRCGAWGDAGSFSFYPSKNLGAMGDGGAVVSSDGELLETVRSLRTHGCAADNRDRHVRIGGTHRLDTLQACMLRLKLSLLDEWNEQRRQTADLYRGRLANLAVDLPSGDPPDGIHVYHLFAVQIDDRNEIAAALRAEGIGVGIHYPTPVHLQPAWRQLGYSPGDFPIAERLSRRTLSLPCFPGISEEQVDRVVDALGRALQHAAASSRETG
jgi:dTDP-4-amino-4,6-dideoxygalactose transaminase